MKGHFSCGATEVKSVRTNVLEDFLKAFVLCFFFFFSVDDVFSKAMEKYNLDTTPVPCNMSCLSTGETALCRITDHRTSAGSSQCGGEAALLRAHLLCPTWFKTSIKVSKIWNANISNVFRSCQQMSENAAVRATIRKYRGFC